MTIVTGNRSEALARLIPDRRDVTAWAGVGGEVDREGSEYQDGAGATVPRLSWPSDVSLSCGIGVLAPDLELPCAQRVAQRLALDPVGHGDAVAIHIG